MPSIHTNKEPGFFGPGSVDVPSPVVEGEGAPRRCALSTDRLVERPFEGINTIHDVISYAVKTHGNRKAIGWRDVVKIVEEEKEVKKFVDGQEVVQKKTWKYFELSDYKYISFTEFEDIISEVARGLLHLGITKDDVFNVYAQTR